jgi:hypothetical protein
MVLPLYLLEDVYLLLVVSSMFDDVVYCQSVGLKDVVAAGAHSSDGVSCSC